MAKIMTVDDAAFMRMFIKDTLKKVGYSDVIEACNGKEAVEKFDEENPDLVFMDITMPIMTGIEALQAIKKKHPNAKIVMCSAMGQEALVMEAVKSGAIDFIVKPFKPERFQQVLTKVFG